MELFQLPSDIQVMFLPVPKFPEEVMETYIQLEKRLNGITERRYFGFSQPNKEGVIHYKACAEVLIEGEPKQFHLETMCIKAGNYMAITIKNHFEDAANIPQAFEKLLKHPQLDPNGFCLELYKNYADPDVICLVPILT